MRLSTFIRFHITVYFENVFVRMKASLTGIKYIDKDIDGMKGEGGGRGTGGGNLNERI